MVAHDPRFEVMVTYFQEFDHRTTVPHHFPIEMEVKLGQIFTWTCGQFTGTAEVVGIIGESGNKRRGLIRKLS